MNTERIFVVNCVQSWYPNGIFKAWLKTITAARKEATIQRQRKVWKEVFITEETVNR